VLRYAHVIRNHLFCPQCTRCFDARYPDGSSALTFMATAMEWWRGFTFRPDLGFSHDVSQVASPLTRQTVVDSWSPWKDGGLDFGTGRGGVWRQRRVGHLV